MIVEGHRRAEVETTSGSPQSIVFVSYDGALDPLGSSQVVPYLVGLAADDRLTLISFEKPRRWSDRTRRDALRQRLSSAGIEWRPMTYHARPRLPATAWDIARGAAAIRRAVRERGATIVHCRGDVAMAMARAARLPRRTRLLYDVRGLFSDERVEAGSWRRGSAVDRTVRWAERANLRRADGIVTLTAAARDALAARRSPLPPHRVIPTAADTDAFRPRQAGEAADHSLVYSGSLGGWYMTREMVAFARKASSAWRSRALFLTPQVADALAAGVDESWADVAEVSPDEVPAWMRRARAAFFFITPTPAKRASCPTKFAEALASGLPVVVNRGVGDLDDVVETEHVGILLDDFSDATQQDAIDRLHALLADPETAIRCRRLAEARYGLRTAVAAYHSLYREIAPGGDHA